MRKLSVGEARNQALILLERASVPLTVADKAAMQIVDFGIGDISRYGIQLVEYINNDRYCARQLVFLPRQTIPEHMHPPIGEDPGKVETFRVVWGKVWVYTEGLPTDVLAAEIPTEHRSYFTAMQQIELNAGEQCTIGDNQFHWFQAADEGAVVIEFSSPARDRYDVFRDPRISR